MENIIDNKIKSILKGRWYEKKEKLTTYKIAKRTGTDWSTALVHLYKLNINHKEIIEKNQRKTVWWL